MSALFRTLAILALAVALTLAAMFNAGYVLLVLPPYRVELSLNLMIFLMLVVFTLAYGLIRLGVSTLNLPAEVRAYRQKRRQEKNRAAMEQAMLAFAAGQYGQAEQLAAAMLEQEEPTEIAALVAARCAHALGSPERRDAYLARAGKTCSDYPEAGMAG
jgi:HemY protein